MGLGKPADIAGAWPCFRGAGRNNIAADPPRLARSWPAEGPPELWSVDLGEGYAGPAVSDGRVYLLDYDAGRRRDVLRCLSLETGQEIWRHGYEVEITRNHGMSRTVPAIASGRVVTLGPRLHLVCWDAETGEVCWWHDLVSEFAAVEPAWYAGQNPLIDGGRVVMAVGGSALFVAFDLAGGDIVWQSPAVKRWQMTHASVAELTVGPRRMFVGSFTGGTAGVDAETGELLWQTSEGRMQVATCPTPLPLPGDRLLLTSGYNPREGTVVLGVRRNAQGGLYCEALVRYKPGELNVEQHTPILAGNTLYAIRKRGGGPLVCFDVNEAGITEQWNTGRLRFGLGPHLLSEDLMFAMNDTGRLALLEVSPVGYRELAWAAIFPEGHDAWGPMALVAGRLLLRDMTRLKCLDVRQTR